MPKINLFWLQAPMNRNEVALFHNELDVWATMDEERRKTAEMCHYGEIFPPISKQRKHPLRKRKQVQR